MAQGAHWAVEDETTAASLAKFSVAAQLNLKRC
jgi:hypothetical protein